MAKTTTTTQTVEKNSIYWCWVRLYGNLVYLGRKTIEQVPEIYREDVEAEVARRKAQGF